MPHVGKGAHYKFHIRSKFNDYRVDKADPFARACTRRRRTPPRSSGISITNGTTATGWRIARQRNAFTAPMSIYEVHLGSWRRDGDRRPLTYREMAGPLAEYVRKMNFTHVELLPVMEHPFYGSWGYQCTGFFAPTSRYGTPQDLMYLIDVLHQNDIGVILDWVPSHFPTDEHGLSYFDGTHLFEHADPRKGFQPDWGSLVFNYGRNEVRSFLLSSALYWLGVYHADGLRVDAVASMLYLDYSRKHGEWIPNEFGGRENIEAIAFLRRLNEDVYKAHPDVQVIAEESTAWPMVSRPTYVGGLGFGMKWDMGWMHDTLRYFAHDPIHRKFHHNDLTFRMMYAFTENFVLPLSHDEVVHGKGSLIRKMPGDEWRRFANLRLLFAHMYSQPAKKLMFMGGEFGQWREWNHDASLDWDLLDSPPNATLQRWVEDLNKAYRDDSGAARARSLARRIRMDRLLRHGEQRRRADAQIEVAAGAAGRRRAELHADPAAQLSGRRSDRRPLGRGAEQRRGDVRRQRAGKHGRRRRRADSAARPQVVGQPDAAAARRGVSDAMPRIDAADDAG